MSGRMNSRLERLETKLGLSNPNISELDGVDLNTLTDDELLDRMYWLAPDRAERWPRWAHMSRDERQDAIIDANFCDLARDGIQENEVAI
jgi:hypothetical protein